MARVRSSRASRRSLLTVCCSPRAAVSERVDRELCDPDPVDQEDYYSSTLRTINELNGWKSSWIVFLVGSLGDSVLAASLLPAFRERHPGRLTIVHPPHVAPLFPALGIEAEAFIPRDMLSQVELCRHLVQHLSPMFAPGIPIVCLPYYFGNLWRAFTSGHQVLAGNVREILRLPPDAPIRYFPRGRHRMAREGSRRVLLSPLTNSLPEAGHEYWSVVADLLQAYGFEVDVNLAGKPRMQSVAEHYPGCRLVECRIAEVLESTDEYSIVVGHPTGLALLQSMIPGETPLVWVNSVDPKKPFFTDRPGEIRTVTRMQEFGAQGTEAQRPVHQFNATIVSAGELAEALVALALP